MTLNLDTYFGLLQQVSILSGFDKPTLYSEMNSLHHDKMKMNLNNQLIHICSYDKSQWKFLEDEVVLNTVDGTKAYDMPTNGDLLRRMYITINNEPYPITLSKNVEGIKGNTVKGRPTRYCVWKNQINFYPIPDAAYAITVEFFKNYYAVTSVTDSTAVTWMDDEDNVPLVPRDHRLTLVYGAARDTIGRPERAEYQDLHQKYKEAFQALVISQRVSIDDLPTMHVKSRKAITYDDIFNDFFSPGW